MNILDIDWDNNKVKSDFQEWDIVSNNANKFLLCQREENGRYRAAEADVKMMHIWEVKEIRYEAPGGEKFVFDEDSGLLKL
jgi:hypothetical protein